MFDNSSFLQDWLQETDPSKQNLVKLFLSQDRGVSRYLFGCNSYSMQLAQSLPIIIDGFIDDYVALPHEIQGVPVIRSKALPENALVVNCVLNAKPITAAQTIKKLSLLGNLTVSDLYKYAPDTIPIPTFVAETREDLRLNAEKWKFVNSLVSDLPSQQVLHDLLRYRLTGDTAFMTGYRYRPEEQYFEDFLNLEEGEVFVDAGGYTGETTEEFCRLVPDYGKTFLFEPSLANLEKAKVRLANKRDIDLIPLGISSSVGLLRFDPDSGSASAVNEHGSVQVDMTTLDHHIREKTTFIKMDLEGWELEALKGSRRHILEDHPKLAICVYHHPADFWRIPEYILSLRSDYKVLLRHYSESWTETVMYFIPK